MKRLYPYILLLFLALTLSPQSFAQKKKRATVNQEISTDLRKQSARFADGLIAYYSNNYELAESTFRTIIEQNGKHSTAYFMLGKVAGEKKDFSQAIYYFKEAQNLDKNNIWYNIEIANAYQKIGDFKSAIKYWEFICQEKKDNEYYLMDLANCYVEINNIPKAVEVLDKITHVIGDNEYITETKVQLWLFINKTENAVNEYAKLIDKYPFNIDNYISAAKILISNNLNNKQQAMKYLLQAEKIDSTHPQLNIMLANLYEQSGDMDNYFKHIIKTFDNEEFTYENKLNIVEQYAQKALRSKSEKDINQAITMTELLIQKHPEEMYALLTLANLQIVKEDYQNAALNYEKVVEFYPNSAALWEKFLIALTKTGNYKAIIKYADNLTTLFPTHATILISIGKAYNQENQGGKALDYLKQASVYAFDNSTIADIYYETGNAHFLLGNKDEALKNWKMSQTKGNNSEILNRKISELENK